MSRPRLGYKKTVDSIWGVPWHSLLGHFTLGKASCHIARQPGGGAHVVGTWSLPMARWTSLDPCLRGPAASHGNNLRGRPCPSWALRWREPLPRSRWAVCKRPRCSGPGLLSNRNWEVTNVCCSQPLSLGVIVYAAINNWYKCQPSDWLENWNRPKPTSFNSCHK